MCATKRITVIGAGQMGHGIALVAAQHGKFKVDLYDIDQKILNTGIESISKWLDKTLAKKIITQIEKKEIIDRIEGKTNLEDAILKSNFIIEAVTENKQVKKDLLKEVSRLASDQAIIVTNTSSIRIAELSSVVRCPERFCGMHFFNPPQLMELVEITKNNVTSDSTVKTVLEVAHKMGKEPVLLKKDCPGFIVNRIMIAALNEAVDIFTSEIADKEDIDKAIKLGLKWPVGPLKLIDQIGIDIVSSIGENLGMELDAKFLPNPIIKEMQKKGLLGRKRGKGFYDWNEN